MPEKRSKAMVVDADPRWTCFERLESRDLLDVSISMMGAALSITGDDGNDQIEVEMGSGSTLVVRSQGNIIGSYNAMEIPSLQVDGGGGNDQIVIAPDVFQRTKLDGGDGDDTIQAGWGDAVLLGGSGNDLVIGGIGNDRIHGDVGNDTLIGGEGVDLLFGGIGDDDFDGGAGFNRLNGGGGADRDLSTGFALGNPVQIGDDPPANVEPQSVLLEFGDVKGLLRVASAATASQDAIIAVVDRNGRILGVLAEAGVSPSILGDPTGRLIFAVDGAVAKARTAAFFANNGAPLTSRTIQQISQSTVLEREVESTWVTNDDSIRGPGYVAPIGIGGHFPPVNNTPTANLFAIEHTNRDSVVHPGPDGIKGTPDDVPLGTRFGVAYNTGKILYAPESFGASQSTRPQYQNSKQAQGRGIATLPGGIPLYKHGQLVGGIGVFFPGDTGFANEENSVLSADHDPTKLDRSFEAEYIAFAAAGGSPMAGFPIPSVPGFSLPFGRIDIDGITAQLFGPAVGGAGALVHFGNSLGRGLMNGQLLTKDVDDVTTNGQPVSSGWIVAPTPGGNLSAADVEQIILQGVHQALETRAAIRLRVPDLLPGAATSMVLSVSDTDGNILGLFRMPDATVFSIDVAVAKARNVSYYSDAADLQTIDQIDDNRDGVPDVPRGVAFTNRTFRYSALPFFPSGVDGTLSGPFSILRDGQADPRNGLNLQGPLPRAAFQSALGHDSFFPGSNFHDPEVANGKTNGVIFFPGSLPIYKDSNGDGQLELVGGFGVSGDGVDQDDVVTQFGAEGFRPQFAIRADQFFVRDIRLPFTKFSRNADQRGV